MPADIQQVYPRRNKPNDFARCRNRDGTTSVHQLIVGSNATPADIASNSGYSSHVSGDWRTAITARPSDQRTRALHSASRHDDRADL